MYYTNPPGKNLPRCPDLRLQPGVASDYIGHAEKLVRPGDRVFLCCRVSGREQDRNGNLDDQEAFLRHTARRLGVVVVGVRNHVGSGWDPTWLSLAAWKAEQAGARLLAESTDRYVRPPIYHSSDDPDFTARDSDLRQLRIETEGVGLLTILHPDASPAEVRSHQRKRGQTSKDNKGGGSKPRRRRWGARRLARFPLALELHKEGLSYRRIAARLNALDDGFSDSTPMTVWNWLHGV